ncbi:MAG TPA: LytTR family DNA-binding domain-containing protein [Terriglobales bacterium]|nr:LytTR family DNA-binding domain-containing protein [Terriglobales bacterium]
MRVLIVDDEPLARNALENILASRTDVESCDSAEDAVAALEKLQSKTYDILLLDIKMPELSGIELIDSLSQRNQPLPSIVFVTAHHEHALAAFEKHAVDYVLKPFSEERIHEALTVAMRRTEGERASKLMEALPQLERALQKPHKIAIKAKGRILFLDLSEVVAVKAEGNYVLLQQQSGSYLLRESLSALAEKLRPHGFIRIHRSVLVNASLVEEVRPCVTGEYLLRLRGGKQFTASRSYKKNLGSLAEFWIGTTAFAGE